VTIWVHAAIAIAVAIERAVEKHVGSTFARRRPAAAERDHRRVLAVLRYLEMAP
jgi:hypothetical protein